MKVLYAKYNSSRKPEHAIKTIIASTDGNKYSEKSALSEASVSFVNGLVDKYNYIIHFPKLPLVPVTPKKIAEGIVRFDFINGSTLQQLLIECASHNDKKGFDKIFKSFLDLLQALPSGSPDRQWLKQFFSVDFSKEEKFIQPGILDLNFDNLIESKGEIYLIDYEWTWKQALPMNYIIFRSLNSLAFELELKNCNQNFVMNLLEKYFREEYMEAEYNFQKTVQNDVAGIELYKTGSDLKNIISSNSRDVLAMKNETLLAQDYQIQKLSTYVNETQSELTNAHKILNSRSVKIALKIAHLYHKLSKSK